MRPSNFLQLTAAWPCSQFACFLRSQAGDGLARFSRLTSSNDVGEQDFLLSLPQALLNKGLPPQMATERPGRRATPWGPPSSNFEQTRPPSPQSHPCFALDLSPQCKETPWAPELFVSICLMGELHNPGPGTPPPSPTRSLGGLPSCRHFLLMKETGASGSQQAYSSPSSLSWVPGSGQ